MDDEHVTVSPAKKNPKGKVSVYNTIFLLKIFNF
jgi:hypothetical protein